MTAKEILIDELNEDAHIERIEDVFFWALEEYAKKRPRTNGSVIADCIIERIREEESKSNNIISKKVAEELNSDPNWWKVSVDGELKMKCEVSKEGCLVYPETIKNTSNASSHVQVLEEESSEMCEIHSVDASGKCFKCGSEPFGHFAMCQDCLEFNHSGNGNF